MRSPPLDLPAMLMIQRAEMRMNSPKSVSSRFWRPVAASGYRQTGVLRWFTCQFRKCRNSHGGRTHKTIRCNLPGFRSGQGQATASNNCGAQGLLNRTSTLSCACILGTRCCNMHLERSVKIKAARTDQIFCSQDICRQIFLHLHGLESKLCFASTCRSAYAASQERLCWQICSIEDGEPHVKKHIQNFRIWGS